MRRDDDVYYSQGRKLTSIPLVHLSYMMYIIMKAEEECLRLVVTQQPKGISAIPGVALAGFIQDHILNGHEAAKQLYMRLGKLYPDDPVAQVALGMNLINSNDDKAPNSLHEAHVYIDRALRTTDRTFVPALRAKGILLTKVGFWSLSMHRDGQVLRKNLVNFFIHSSMYMHPLSFFFSTNTQGKDVTTKNLNKASELFRYGLHLMPNNVALLRTTAMHLLACMPLSTKQAQGVQRRVLSLFDKALELEPTHLPTLIACALAKVQCFQDTKGAEIMLQKVLSITKATTGAHRSNSACHKQYRALAYRLLGHLYYDVANHEAAQTAFKSSLRQQQQQQQQDDDVHDPHTMIGYAAALIVGGTSANKKNAKASPSPTKANTDERGTYIWVSQKPCSHLISFFSGAQLTTLFSP